MRSRPYSTILAAAFLCGHAVVGAMAHAQISDDTKAAHFDGAAGTPCDSPKGLPCDRTPAHLAKLDDPTRWNRAGRDPNAPLFRRATRKERAANAWPIGTFLVDGAAAFAATSGAHRFTLAVPLKDTRVQAVELVLGDRIDDLEFIERRANAAAPGRVDTRVLRPTLYQYFDAGFDPRNPKPRKGAWATAVAGDDGGFFASGVAAGFEFEAGGPNRWELEDVPGPSGFAPNPAGLLVVKIMSLGTHGRAQFKGCAGAAPSAGCSWLCTEVPGVPCDRNPHIHTLPDHNCIDGVTNDQDATVDSGDEDCQSQPQYGDDLHPGFPRRDWESGKAFALFGEGRFCTRYADPVDSGGNWIQRLTAIGWKAESLINNSVGFQEVLPREGQVRYRGGACWIFPSPAAAAACNDSGSQCLAGYPYADAGASSDQYYGRVWNDVHHAMFHGLKDALHLAQVVHWGGTDVALSCDAGEAVCCGAALSPTASPGGVGSSVIQYEYSAGAAQCSIANAGPTSAHELGHTLGLEHNDLQSFMHTPAYNGSLLPDADRDLLVGCMNAADCPRPSGFRWIPPGQ